MLDLFLIPYTKLNCWWVYRPECEQQIHIFLSVYLYDLGIEKDLLGHKNNNNTKNTEEIDEFDCINVMSDKKTKLRMRPCISTVMNIQNGN